LEPSSTPPRHRGSPEAIREAILTATIRLIGRGGTAAVTHRAIAAEAGVSLSSTTYHFASKDEIISEALRRVAALEIENVAEQATALLEDLHPEAFTSALVGWLAEQLEGELLLVVRAGYHLQLEAKDRPELREIHLEWAAAVQGVAEEVLKRAGSAQPRADAHILATVLDGLRLEEIASPRPGAEQRLRPVVGRLLAALTSPPP